MTNLCPNLHIVGLCRHPDSLFQPQVLPVSHSSWPTDLLNCKVDVQTCVMILHANIPKAATACSWMMSFWLQVLQYSPSGQRLTPGHKNPGRQFYLMEISVLLLQSKVCGCWANSDLVPIPCPLVPIIAKSERKPSGVNHCKMCITTVCYVWTVKGTQYT